MATLLATCFLPIPFLLNFGHGQDKGISDQSHTH